MAARFLFVKGGRRSLVFIEDAGHIWITRMSLSSSCILLFFRQSLPGVHVRKQYSCQANCEDFLEIRLLNVSLMVQNASALISIGFLVEPYRRSQVAIGAT
ncbi:unnamed protein product [Cyclocybe aegerita]|uniref:Uncharacterized protein n=1 Tax=Cyclocybe aegerita TaxID=1973307 RepID=A0A8S0VXF9_CYCAE|nr:unnamed protein product [Cyclocybe aegerita]